MDLYIGQSMLKYYAILGLSLKMHNLYVFGLIFDYYAF